MNGNTKTIDGILGVVGDEPVIWDRHPNEPGATWKPLSSIVGDVIVFHRVRITVAKLGTATKPAVGMKVFVEITNIPGAPTLEGVVDSVYDDGSFVIAAADDRWPFMDLDWGTRVWPQDDVPA